MRRVVLLLVGLLALASVLVASPGGAIKAQPRWVITQGAGHDGELNVTWFELDLPLPGAPKSAPA